MQQSRPTDYGKHRKRIVIKIGSSSLTSVQGELSRHKLNMLVDEVTDLRDEGYEVILVSSGAVAAGYRKLGCLTRPTELSLTQAAASIGQGLLMEAYSERFLSHGYVASQILITRGDFSDRKRYRNVRNAINVLLERGIVPIINENDTITVERLRFGDNDTLSAKVAGLADADQLIILSDIDGLYDGDPRRNPEARLLRNVKEITPEIEALAGDSGSSVGTGGMRSKIDAVKIAAASGVPTFIGKANTPRILTQAVKEGARGTYFEAQKEDNLDGKKQWIAFNSGTEGDIIVTDQALEVIMNQDRHLEMAHIQNVLGQFSKNSVVRILTGDNREIGRGVVMCDADELRRCIGGQSAKSHNEKAVIAAGEMVCSVHVPVLVGG
ncbi:glutamate 5-kinase [Aneurinibacillus sp. REN35]|uniref:glutamate 5-kinase n=1 Tax=Aneurinibacillus sp. REN35 TaxID=3237286 RepID=UPI003526F278